MAAHTFHPWAGIRVVIFKWMYDNNAEQSSQVELLVTARGGTLVRDLKAGNAPVDLIVVPDDKFLDPRHKSRKCTETTTLSAWKRYMNNHSVLKLVAGTLIAESAAWLSERLTSHRAETDANSLAHASKSSKRSLPPIDDTDDCDDHSVVSKGRPRSLDGDPKPAKAPRREPKRFFDEADARTPINKFRLIARWMLREFDWTDATRATFIATYNHAFDTAYPSKVESKTQREFEAKRRIKITSRLDNFLSTWRIPFARLCPEFKRVCGNVDTDYGEHEEDRLLIRREDLDQVAVKDNLATAHEGLWSLVQAAGMGEDDASTVDGTAIVRAGRRLGEGRDGTELGSILGEMTEPPCGPKTSQSASITEEDETERDLSDNLMVMVGPTGERAGSSTDTRASPSPTTHSSLTPRRYRSAWTPTLDDSCDSTSRARADSNVCATPLASRRLSPDSDPASFVDVFEEIRSPNLAQSHHPVYSPPVASSPTFKPVADSKERSPASRRSTVEASPEPQRSPPIMPSMPSPELPADALVQLRRAAARSRQRIRLWPVLVDGGKEFSTWARTLGTGQDEFEILDDVIDNDKLLVVLLGFASAPMSSLSDTGSTTDRTAADSRITASRSPPRESVRPVIDYYLCAADIRQLTYCIWPGRHSGSIAENARSASAIFGFRLLYQLYDRDVMKQRKRWIARTGRPADEFPAPRLPLWRLCELDVDTGPPQEADALLTFRSVPKRPNPPTGIHEAIDLMCRYGTNSWRAETCDADDDLDGGAEE